MPLSHAKGNLPVFSLLEHFCFTVPFDENDVEEDVDSEPAEIEEEAAENGDTGDTGAELDDGNGEPQGLLPPPPLVTICYPLESQ